MSEPTNVTQIAKDHREGFKVKADHNKNEALLCFILVISSSLIAPLFVTLGEGLVLGKIIPSILSLVAAGTTTWLQLRKPQQLWALYRDCQRKVEREQMRHEFKFGGYEKSSNPDRLLMQRVSDIAMDAHDQWMPMVPNPERIGAMTEQKLLKQGETADDVST